MHIGPLIGSKTDKGPCQKNSTHLHDKTLSPVQFKTENIRKNIDLDIDVKPEIIDSHSKYDTIDGARNHKKIDSIDRSYEKIALVPQHHPNYTLNPKLLEQPEMSISPARGSIGPGIPKIQAGATQPLEKPVSSLNQTPLTGRRARVGKNMAREMMLQSHPTINDSTHEMEMDLQGDSLCDLKKNICASTPIKEQIHNEEYEKNNTNTPHFLSTSTPVNGKLIKQEDVKKECDDDILLISDKSDSETISSDLENSDSIQIIDLSSDKNQTNEQMNNSLKRHCDNGSSADEIIDLDEENSMAHVKRRRILEFHKNPTKKSPPNSYKNLIKPSDPKSYLCRADSITKDKDQSTKCTVPKIVDESMNESQDDLHMNGSGENKLAESNEIRTEIIGKSLNAIPLLIGDEFPHELSAAEEEKLMSHLDSNSENISKGYCSDNEILSRKKERLKTKLQKCEGRSRSESKKCDKIPTGKSTTKSEKSKPRKNSRDRSTSSSKSKDRTDKPPAKKSKLTADIVTPCKSSTSSTSSAKKKTETKMKKSKTPKAKKSCDKTKKTSENRMKNTDADDTLLDNESHINNNNNCILLDKNNKLHLDALVAPTFNVSRIAPPKKGKSRGTKFSNKKKHRVRHPKNIEEVIIPRQTSTAPRWSNGWNWKGEPYQGKVFLNVS